jgi:hypothetical protein
MQPKRGSGAEKGATALKAIRNSITRPKRDRPDQEDTEGVGIVSFACMQGSIYRTSTVNPHQVHRICWLPSNNDVRKLATTPSVFYGERALVLEHDAHELAAIGLVDDNKHCPLEPSSFLQSQWLLPLPRPQHDFGKVPSRA